MAPFTAKIETIFPGISPVQNFSQEGQFDSSIAIDPDMPVDDSSIRTSGLLRPTAMAKFSASEVTGVPHWIVPNPKTSSTYVYANDGKVHVVTSALAMDTAITAPSSSSGNGAEYYDNYMYFAKNTDVARYGPLNGVSSLTQSYWVTTLSKTALVDTTYPSIRGIEIPNHPMHRHAHDNKLYFGDVVGNQGVLHYIKTSKTTVEGDTDATSTYNALDFPYGYYPTVIESYGTDVAVALIEGVNTTIMQKPAIVSFWDTTGSSFSKIIDVAFPDPLITAMKNVNGSLYVWSGNASGGVRVSRFLGGYSFEEVSYSEEGVPPFQGAVDHDMNRIVWGGYTTYPEASAGVLAYGSKNRKLNMGLHNIFKSTSAGANGIVTAVKFLEHANNSIRRPIIGWTDDSAKGLDKISTTYGTSVFRSETFRIGKPWIIHRIRIPFAQAIAANMTFVVKLYVDELSSSTTLATINSTNYANSERNIVLKPFAAKGNHSFLLEFRWTGTVLLTAALPVVIEGEINDD